MLSLVPLAGKITKLLYTTKKLALMLDSESESYRYCWRSLMGRDIGAIALKSLLLQVPVNHFDLSPSVQFILPTLLQDLSKDKPQSLDVIDLIADVIAKFANIINSSPDGRPLQLAIQQQMLSLLLHQRPVVRKRSIVVLAALGYVAFDEIFSSLSKSLISLMLEKSSEKDYEKLATVLACLAAVCKVATGDRMSSHMPLIVSSTLEYISIDNDDLKEQCLQSLQVFVENSRALSDQLEVILQASVSYISYDPNYIEDDEDMDVDDEDEDDDDGDYDDDDDVSWKVRRAAVKLLSALVVSHPQLLVPFYQNISPLVIKRFSEREEIVRLDVLGTYTTIVNETTHLGMGSVNSYVKPVGKKRKGSKGEQLAGHSPDGLQDLVKSQIPLIVSALSKQVQGNSIQTVQAGYVLLKCICRASHGGFDSSIGMLIPAIQNGLSTTTGSSLTNTNIKIEVLELISLLCEFHDADVLGPYFMPLTDCLTDATNDKFYKVRAEALGVVGQIVSTFCQRDLIQRVDDVELVRSLFDASWNCLTGNELEAEVVEKAISTVSTTVAICGDLLGQQVVQSVLGEFLGRIKVETTRLATARAVTLVCDSPVIVMPQNAVWIPFIPEMEPFITKAHRQTAMDALHCLLALVKRCGSELDSATQTAILNDLSSLFAAHKELQVLPLGFDLLASLLSSSHHPAMFPPLQTDIIPKVVDIIINYSHSVAGGAGLDSLLHLWRQMMAAEPLTHIYSLGVEVLLDLFSKSTVPKEVGGCRLP
ncbi:Cullin-associated NEDD8-dissociated protein 2 [Kappamyces sp. JEL0680]|nr:Cullin-associated NEDD8-dissociated protein 2 [Kappamyces sp. JEL0680]